MIMFGSVRLIKIVKLRGKYVIVNKIWNTISILLKPVYQICRNGNLRKLWAYIKIKGTRKQIKKKKKKRKNYIDLEKI